MNRFMRFAVAGGIVTSLLALAFPLHTSVREGYTLRFLNLRSYGATEWVAIWGLGAAASLAGHVVRRRLPFLSDTLLLAGGLCLIIPTIGRSHVLGKANAMLTLGVINMVYLIWVAVRLSQERLSNQASEATSEPAPGADSSSHQG